MTAQLHRPDNGQPADFHAYRDGMIALDTTCIAPAVRWFTMQAVQVCNPTTKLLAAFDSGLDYRYPQPAPLTVVLTPEMAANVNASALVSIVVRKPVAVSLWADGLRVA